MHFHINIKESTATEKTGCHSTNNVKLETEFTQTFWKLSL